MTNCLIFATFTQIHKLEECTKLKKNSTLIQTELFKSFRVVCCINEKCSHFLCKYDNNTCPVVSATSRPLEETISRNASDTTAKKYLTHPK